MGAPKGNQFWQLRYKHGRDKIFANPDLLWEAACEYFQHIIDNPIIKTEVTEKPNGTETKTITLAQPFTWDGFELFIDISSLRKYKTEESHKDFIQVITRIGKVIDTQKFSGAAAGIFNANIIARDLGLKDSSEHDLKSSDGSMKMPVFLFKDLNEAQ